MLRYQVASGLRRRGSIYGLTWVRVPRVLEFNTRGGTSDPECKCWERSGESVIGIYGFPSRNDSGENLRGLFI